MASLLDSYKSVLKDFPEMDAEYGKMLFLAAGNPAGGILLCGLNPSLGNAIEQVDIPFKEFSGDFWNPVKALVRNHLDETAYIDLFPLRKTVQTQFETLPVDFRARILEKTQEEIERLSPRLIVHLNAGSSYYWGPRGWMGYAMEDAGVGRIKGARLLRIKGFNLDCRNRVNTSFRDTCLKGTHILFYRMLSSRYEKALPKELRLGSEDLDRIWEHINK